MEPNDSEAYEKIAARIPAKELSTLLKVSSSLASTMDLAQVLQIAIESAVDLLDLDTGAIYTLEDEVLQLGATVPTLTQQLPQELLLARLEDHPHIREAVSTKSPVRMGEARKARLSAGEKAL